jgi:glycosyltransferase involved in cell wall biosynthesis
VVEIGKALHVFLDVSRLLLCVLRPSPAGIDRVELAYARRWLGRPAACSFVAQNAWGGLATLPHRQVERLVTLVEAVWQAGPLANSALAAARRLVLRLHAGMAAGAGRWAFRRAAARADRGIYLLVSHLSLENPDRIAGLRRQGLAFVPMVHDLIPSTHPEYARPQQVGRHRRRISTTASLADGVIVNSTATAEALLSHLPEVLAPGCHVLPPIVVARLGVAGQPTGTLSPWSQPDRAGGERPYFVTLGTIEPRKNHLLLLNLWREMAARMGNEVPRLLVIGRRGWENENILDMLDRCSALNGAVQETGPLPDAEVTRLLAGARALLFPSFAEGYGLPLAEALALGTPAICSDLPALREVGAAVPEFLDPLDGPAWRDAVLHYAQPQAPRREAQLSRLRHWQPPSWATHFHEVDALLARVAAAPHSQAPNRQALFPQDLFPQPQFPWGEALRPAGGGAMAEPALAARVPAAPAE